MRIPECPKNLGSCTAQCPMYKCWALDKYEQSQEREANSKEDGWE